MNRTSHKVGLVVDRSFGERIVELARSFHVWVVESPANVPFVRRFWESQLADSGPDPLASGITSFVAGEHEMPADICARIAETVDQHHGEFAHDPPWTELEVFGVELDSALQEVFKDLGATTFEPTPEGFVCRRE